VQRDSAGQRSIDVGHPSLMLPTHHGGLEAEMHI
jgi:hypothetical protein